MVLDNLTFSMMSKETKEKIFKNKSTESKEKSAEY